METNYQLNIRGLDMILRDLSSNRVISNKIANLSDWLHSLGFTDIQIGKMITSQDYLALELSLTSEQYGSFLYANCNLIQFPFRCIQSYMNKADEQEYSVAYDIQLISYINAIEGVTICIM